MINLTDARAQINSGEPFNMKICKLDGELIEANNVVCTSSFHHGNTMNIKHKDSDQFRKYKVFLLLEFNGQEVYL